MTETKRPVTENQSTKSTRQHLEPHQSDTVTGVQLELMMELLVEQSAEDL